MTTRLEELERLHLSGCTRQPCDCIFRALLPVVRAALDVERDHEPGDVSCENPSTEDGGFQTRCGGCPRCRLGFALVRLVGAEAWAGWTSPTGEEGS